MMLSCVRVAKLRSAFSRTAFGFEMSRKAVDWGLNLTKEPRGRETLRTVMIEPSERSSDCMSHHGT